MLGFLISRVFQAIIALIVLSMIVFAMSRVSGSPVFLLVSLDATQEDFDRVEKSLGLDKSWPEQYWIFVKNIVQGDLGDSVRSRTPVIELFQDRIEASAQLAFVALIIVALLGIPLGIIAAVKRGTVTDYVVRTLALLGQSMPSFWVAILLIQVVSVQLDLLPAGGKGGFSFMILPAATMAFQQLAGVTRLLRTSMLDVLDSEYVKLARLEGIPDHVIFFKHALRNALIPVVTFGGLFFASFLTSAIVVEVVFAWPGMGSLIFSSILFRDFPVVQGVVLFAAAMVIAINLLVDILYAVIDPRIRYSTA